jgi:hypothetical protein
VLFRRSFLRFQADLDQAADVAITSVRLYWTAESKRLRKKVAIVLVDNNGLARGRGTSRLKHWYPSVGQRGNSASTELHK